MITSSVSGRVAFGLQRTSVKYSDTKPFLMVELQKISDNLDRSKYLQVTEEELMHRNSLGTAMSLLKEMSARETELLQEDRSAASFGICRETVKLEGDNECTSSQNVIDQKASDSTMVNKDRTTLKREKSLRFAEHSKCLRTSNKPKDQNEAQRTDLDNGKKRRVESTNARQSNSLSTKKAAPKPVCLKSSSAEKDEPEKGKTRRARFNRPLSPQEEMPNEMLHAPDQANTRKRNCHSKRLMPHPSKKDIVKDATTKKQATSESDTDEKESHRKSRYQLPLPDFSFSDTDLLSSELSMECSSPESSIVPEVWPNDDTEEDAQLPVIELKKEPVSIERGAFVWCKFQRYPYWPSLVKLVRSKEKRASIIFLEECLCDPNSQKKSFQVSFRTLKHYDCLEKQELLAKARKDYGKSVDWCDALICDYRIRLGCNSFSGSFLEYCASAISYPVRKECCKTKLDFPSIRPEKSDSETDRMDKDPTVEVKILPDRARASRDRANEKLVECIVNSRQAEHHLMGILKGKKKSHYLAKFKLPNQNYQETYFEDEKQAELVVDYLRNLCKNISGPLKKLINGDETKFIVEVLIPEAVIFAISATERVSYGKAEEKFLKGPLLSKR